MKSNKGKAKKKEDPVVDDPNLAVAAMAVAAAVEDKQHPPTKEQSVEDAAAEAGLAVVTETADDHHMPPPLPSPPMGPPLPEESPYPYPINAGKDVISGKGGKVQQYNRHFRNLVAQNYGAYDATTSKIAKRRIGVHIYSKITEAGGRFLDEKGIEMDRSKGILKVMKALKDAKTWTSDAKRAAKERREAKQREGGDKKEIKAEDKAPSTTAVEFAAAKLALESAAVLDAEEVAEEKSPKADKKKDKKKAAKPAEEEEASGRRSSKRRQLPLGSSTPPSKKDKKGGDSAVSGLHLLSQATHAVAGKKKGRKVKAETVAQV